MFTKNFYRTLANYMASERISNNKFIGMTGESVSLVSSTMPLQFGNTSTSNYYCSMHRMHTSLIDTANGGVIIGTGNDPETVDDYKLSGDLITGYTYSADVTFQADETGCTFTGVYTITNTGSAPFTIGEIGLMTHLYTSTTKEEKYKGLLERTVLDTPVTVPAGGIGQVTYTIRFNYPTA